MASVTKANGTTEIIHSLDLDEYGLKDVPSFDKQNAKQEVASYLENQILRDVNNGVSPVKGEGRFARLETDYAKEEKGGNRLSNLENEGDLLNDFKVALGTTSFLSVGHRGREVPKSDGHNQLSGKAKSWAIDSGMPKRRYIPDSNQKFTNNIVNEIRDIIGDFKRFAREDTDTVDAEPTVSSAVSDLNATSVTTDNAFSDDVIDALLRDAQSRRG